MGRWPGNDWTNTWQWTKRFTMPAINHWPKCPKENQMSTTLPVQRQLQCFYNDNWTISTGSFCSLSVFVVLWVNSKYLPTNPCKRQQLVTSHRSENFKVSNILTRLLIELLNFLDFSPHLKFLQSEFTIHLMVSENQYLTVNMHLNEEDSAASIAFKTLSTDLTQYLSFLVQQQNSS
jgi:hypothetical protein